MDRYEAEALLDAKPEGSFLLRDSAQDEYLFRYDRLNQKQQQKLTTYGYFTPKLL